MRSEYLVSLINVENSINDKNVPVGHELKMLRDYQYIFKNNIELLAEKKYIEKLGVRGTLLPYAVCSGKQSYTNLKVLCNYFISLVLAKGDVLLFIDTPEPLLWGVALFKGKRKIISITYLQWDKYISKYISNNYIRRFLVKRGLSRLDGCIVTNPLYIPEVPFVKVPDYYITDEIIKYQNNKKRRGCVCLGEIRPEKDVVGLVRVIRKTSLFLLIAGSFQDQNIYRKVNRMRTENIKIENRNLSYDTYMKYLSEYKYIILPYDPIYYNMKTSGVLLEAIFLGTVPIAPKNILEHNQIQGLGYRAISEIPELISLYEQGEIKVENNLAQYRYECYKDQILKFLNYVIHYS